MVLEHVVRFGPVKVSVVAHVLERLPLGGQRPEDSFALLAWCEATRNVIAGGASNARTRSHGFLSDDDDD